MTSVRRRETPCGGQLGLLPDCMSVAVAGNVQQSGATWFLRRHKQALGIICPVQIGEVGIPLCRNCPRLPPTQRHQTNLMSMPFQDGDLRTIRRELPGVVESNVSTTARLKWNPYQFFPRTAEWIKCSNHQFVLIYRRPPKHTKVRGLVGAPEHHKPLSVK